MLEIKDLLAFVKVVETESLTKAGRALAVPKSTISRRLTRLEEQLGAQLVRRTTHQVAPTEQGVLFYEYCQRCLGLLRDGEHAVRDRLRNPQGLLRLSVPPELDRGLLGGLMTDYLERYPDVRLLTRVASDPVVSLRQGFDLAVVSGALPLAETAFVARKLGVAEHRLYAAPGYVERNGMPQSRVDLTRFDLLALGDGDVRANWRLRREDAEASVEFSPRMLCNDLLLLRHAVRAGLGIAMLPELMCREDVAHGRLIPMLPGWHAPSRPFYAVFPNHRAMPPHLRALIDFMVARLRPDFGGAESAPADPSFHLVPEPLS